MTDKDQISDSALETFFEAARAQPPQVPEALMARVLADAAAQAPQPKGRGLFGWLSAIGGLPALGGLVTATCVGFWLGVAPPDVLPDIAGAVIGAEALALDDGDAAFLDSFGWELDEG